MTQTIAAIRVPPPGELPLLARWVVRRERLARRLDRGVSGTVTLVTAPPGWGKTLGVAAWAAGARASEDVVWLSGAGAAADPELFLELLRESLVEEGAPHLAPVPPGVSPEARRAHALAGLGRSLSRGPRRVLVLDDYPTGEVGALGRDLGVVLDHARRRLSLVLVSRGEPAFPVQRHRVAGDLTRITLPDLAMDWLEVAGVLARHEVVAEEPTARTVERHTEGWPVGVRLAALALRDVCSVGEALEEADRATVDLLASEVLREAPARVRSLLVRTSMVEEVDRDLARRVGGPAAETAMTPAAASETFVELCDDLSFRCPPLLRAAAAAELAREPLEVRREATRRAAQWHVDHDRVAAGLQLAVEAGDWPWVGRALVESYVVPQILSAGVATAAVPPLATSVRATEPVIEAALCLRNGGPAAAEAALNLLDQTEPASGVDVAGEVSALCVRLAVARARGDVDPGMLVAARLRELVPQLPIGPQRELIAFVEAHVGSLAACDGQLARARAALRRGAAEADGDRGRAVVQDCQGQLALLDAFQGDLRAAELQAAAVLRRADVAAYAGTAHAHLAAAWVHVERAEHALARQRLDRAAEAAGDGVEPWYRTACLLAEVRLLIGTDQPETALRLLPRTGEASTAAGSTGWGVALLTLAAADALVAAGEPLAALHLVVPGPASTPVANGVLAARALAALGEVSGARGALAAVSPDLSRAPLDVQVEHWLLEARLAEEAGSFERARLLVRRALRVSGREQLRRPCARESAWLVPLVERDAALRREYGGFLTRLATASAGRSTRVAVQAGSAPVLVETLTAREAQVLGMLADMCSTEEIARELYLSVNTIKTYVRGVLRKLAVNRRVDAVRRGHELGLC